MESGKAALGQHRARAAVGASTASPVVPVPNVDLKLSPVRDCPIGKNSVSGVNDCGRVRVPAAGRFIKDDREARRIGHLPASVYHAIWSLDDLELLCNGAHHLHSHDVVGRRVGEMQRRASGDRPESVMGRDADRHGFRHGCDFLGFAEATTVAEGGLEDANGAVRQSS